MKEIKTREELQSQIKELEAKISDLENTESKSSAWLENSPVCTKIVDLDFNLQYMSNAGIRALQVDDVSELYGKPYPLSFFPDAYKIAMSKDLLRVKETGKTIIQEGEIRDVKGNKLWFQATITPVYNKQGEIDHIMVVSLDASANKQAKDELFKSERKYRELVNRAQEGIWVIDKDNATSFVNPSMARMLGYSEKEMLGKSLFDFMDETGVKIANENLERRQNGINDQHDFEFICKNGERIITSLETAPITDKLGNYDGAIAGVMNITERKKIEEKEKSHHRNIDFLSKTAMQFVEFPLDNNIYNFVGEQVREFVGKDSYIVVNSVDSKTGFSTIQSVTGTGRLTKIISNKLGNHPVGMNIKAEDSNVHYQDGRLHVYEEGLYGLLLNTVPKSICKSIENLAGVKKIYVIDLVNQEQFFGNVILFLKEETAELQNKQLIETFIKQASIAILKRQAEEALQTNEAKLNLIVNSSPTGICTVDLLGNFITTNPEYERMLGYAKEELMELSFYDVTHPNDRPKNKKLFQDMFSLETTGFSMEKRYIRKDGEEIKVSVHAIGIRDAEGKVKFGNAFVDDITERKEAENKLRNTNARHSAMIENIGDVIAIMGADGRVNYQSPNIEKWFGWTQKDIINTIGWDYLHPEDIKRNQKEFSKLLEKENASTTIEFRYKCKDGNYKWVEQNAVNRINDPAIKGILLNYHDISERKIAEQTISLSNTRYKALFDDSPIPLWEEDLTDLLYYLFRLKEKGHKDLRNYFEKNPNTLMKCAEMVKIIDVNQAALDMHKAKSKEQLIGNLSEIFTEKSFIVFKEELLALVEGKEEFESESEVKTLEGDLKNIHINLKIDKSQAGKVKTLLAISDITERKQIEEKLFESIEMLNLALEGANAGLWSWNIKTGDDLLDERWCAILGYTKAEIRQHVSTWEVLMHPDDKDRVGEVLNKHFETENSEFKQKYRMKCKNGQWKWIFAVGKVVKRDTDGAPAQMTGIIIDIAEQKLAEEKLKESEERFRKLIDNMPSGVAVYKMLDNANDFEFIDINKKAEEITNTSNKEIIGHSLLETFPNMKNGPFVESLTKVSRTGIDIYLPPFFYKDDQRQGWRENNIYKLASGEIVAIFKDVTDLKEAEEKLKKQNIELLEAKEKAEESNDRFNLAMTAAKDGLYDWNLVTNEIYYSPGWKRMLGYGDDELPNNFSVWEKLIEVEDLEKSWKMQQELINKQRDRFELEFKMKHKDGHWVDILSRAEAVFDENDKAIRMVGTHVDITERKKSEGLVRRLSTAVQQSPSIVVITDIDGNLEFVNPKFTELTGYSSAEAIGQKSNILKSGMQDFTFYKDLWKTIVSGKVWRGQFQNKKKNGELFWEAASISAILNESGDIINFIKIGEDITQQKQRESDLKVALEKALESDRLKSAFLANMSHEIRTPMNGILGFINLLNEPDLSKIEIEEYSAVINRSGNRLLTTINDIIDISRIESGEMDIVKTETDINNMMDELYSFFSPEVKLKGLSLLFKPATEQLTMNTDSHKLHGILTNLIKNAIKFTEVGSITFGYVLKKDILLKEQGGRAEVKFFVEDTGTGIPKDRIEAIFRRFEQADIEDVRALEGSGLGLAISKAYIEMLGGDIFVESEYGKGSKFTFTIPIFEN